MAKHAVVAGPLPTAAQLVGWLAHLGACPAALKWIQRTWDPDQALQYLQHVPIEYITWLAVTLDLPCEQTYDRALTRSNAAYRAIQEPAQDAYIAIQRPAYVVYRAIERSARAAYDALVDAASETYTAIKADAYIASRAADRPDFTGYHDIERRAWAAYSASKEQAYAALQAIEAPALRAYKATADPAFAAYQAIRTPARKAYEAAQVQADNERVTTLRSHEGLAQMVAAWRNWREETTNE